MKQFIVLLVLAVLCLNVSAQKKLFLRIHSLSGKKVYRGFYAGGTDSTVTLLSGEQYDTIPVSSIAVIKTKRSAGHTILVTAIVSSVILSALLVAGSGESSGFLEYSAGDGLLAGLLGGAVGGSFLGALISGPIKRPWVEVNGKQENWLTAKLLFDKVAKTTFPATN